ncbi:MAG: DegV family EDD domain-containing protein [Candidatus Gottesmanbacteria bacterium]|nr:DegV family EDD domain-containing protein [Candidatus Gottesmanbacteria bacterium]
MSGVEIVPKRLIVSDTCISKAPEGVPIIPLHIIWPDKQDQLDSEFSENPEKFYEKMQSFMDKGFPPPTTTQPSIFEFTELYTELYRRGAREIGSVHVMSTKSGTFGNAVLAAREVMAEPEYHDMKILAMDSGAVSLAQLFQVETAVNEQKEGASLDEINKILMRNAEKDISLYVAIETFKYLWYSGRVSGLAATLGDRANLKVIVRLKHNNLERHQITKGMEHAKQRIVDNLREDIDTRKALPSHVGVIYTRYPEIGEELKVLLGDILREPGVGFAGSAEAGALLGIHAGPGAGALAALWADA